MACVSVRVHTDQATESAPLCVTFRSLMNSDDSVMITVASPPGATQPIVGVYFTALCRALASSRTRLLDHTQRRARVGRTPLNE
jgi:hypothetical protein